ncbi:MAG: DEAD/DEAH box helicase [Fibrobacter sp.]|nr:DEAD/DEAH box helicase [Fibrobacter sp.]
MSAFDDLKNISQKLLTDIDKGREDLIKFIDQPFASQLTPVVNSLLEKAGLYLYMTDEESCDLHQKILLELHKPIGMENCVLHGKQGEVYRLLLDGENVILSAPTSFGKSFLIDAVIASQKYSNIVIIVPSIALIEETRERIAKNFSQYYKVISFPSQKFEEKNICIFTQERFLETSFDKKIDFFVIDEFYKLNAAGENRSIALNEAFYKLLKEKCQFFMIGPNIESIKKTNEQQIEYKFIKTDFKTVAVNVYQMGIHGCPSDVPTLCKNLEGQTLIFCKSSNSINQLAKEIKAELPLQEDNLELKDFIEWLEINYSKDWIIVDLLRYGIGYHHAGLPRAISQYILHLFNCSKIKFLLSTNTIIEGVNTSAKNMIIYDNKIASKKFDLFTFNNIRGRAGRMFKHFVGNIYLKDDYVFQESLPIVDIPVLGEQKDMPETLLLGMEESDLSEAAKERLKYLHAQQILPYEIIKKHNGIQPQQLLDCADKIRINSLNYYDLLSWNNLPNKDQVDCISELIFSFLCPAKRGNGVVSSKQLAYRLKALQNSSNFALFIKDQIKNATLDNIDEGIEDCLKFVRNWCDYILPMCLNALNDIQNSVFSSYELKSGDYSFYIQKIRNYFDKTFASAFEELGLPIQIYSRLPVEVEKDAEIDDLMLTIKNFSADTVDLQPFEKRILKLVQKSI